MAGSAQFYRDQAARIAALAEAADDPALRSELLALAERFMNLADHAARFHRNYGAAEPKPEHHTREP